jgi:NADP-dependent 3-hydroxy acid dehydrogenase YdfG
MTATQSIDRTTSGRLNGKVALVTGASSGIGSATAQALAAAGAKLVLAARREDRLKAIADDIAQTGSEVLVLPVDLSDERATFELVERAYTHWGRLDMLINSAGIADAGSVETAAVSSWRRMFDINTLGLMIACKSVIPLMKAQGGGHIVNISSTAGLFVESGASGYSASKFAVEAFSTALRLEVSKADRIRITAIEPGLVETARRHSRSSCLCCDSTTTSERQSTGNSPYRFRYATLSDRPKSSTSDFGCDRIELTNQSNPPISIIGITP